MTRAAALLGLLFLVCFSDIVSGQRLASCSVYRMADRSNLACPRDFQPVCGTDNVTYPNECSLCREIFRNRVIDKKHDGKCTKVDCTGYMRTTGGQESLCTRHYNPLCATNGVTYSNKCSFCTAVANGEDINLLMPGKCPKFRNTKIDCSGFKNSGFKDTVFCTAEYMPLCGSDGRTYGNKCHFCIAVQKSRGSLTLKHHGEC